MAILGSLFDVSLDGATERVLFSDGTPSNAANAEGSFRGVSAVSWIGNVAFTETPALVIFFASSSSDSEAYPDRSARPDILIAN